MVSVEDNHIIIIFEVSSSFPKEVSKKLKDKMNNLQVLEDDFNRKVKVLIATSILGYDDATTVNSDIRADIIKYGKIIDNLNEVMKKLKYDDIIAIIDNLKKYFTSEVILKPND